MNDAQAAILRELREQRATIGVILAQLGAMRAELHAPHGRVRRQTADDEAVMAQLLPAVWSVMSSRVFVTTDLLAMAADGLEPAIYEALQRFLEIPDEGSPARRIGRLLARNKDCVSGGLVLRCVSGEASPREYMVTRGE